jgi:hypothetical protein
VEPSREPDAIGGQTTFMETDMAKMLERFVIARAADGYMITIEDDSGDTLELTATFDQLDLITEELDRALDEDADDSTLIDEEDADDVQKDDD